MSKAGKIAIVVALAFVVGVVIVTKKARTHSTSTATAPAGLPRLLDLGSVSCIPCKLMAPILEELRKDYAGRLQVEFIDVNENAQAAGQYGINLIPTQIFFDAAGKELWRHEGFISKEDILDKWKELGVDLAPAAPATGPAFSRPAASSRPSLGMKRI